MIIDEFKLFRVEILKYDVFFKFYIGLVWFVKSKKVFVC